MSRSIFQRPIKTAQTFPMQEPSCNTIRNGPNLKGQRYLTLAQAEQAHQKMVREMRAPFERQK